MEPTKDHICQLREEGWVLIEGCLTETELSAAQQGAKIYYPSVEEYEANTEKCSWLQGDPYAGVKWFPFSDSYLNNLLFHPAMLQFTGQALESQDFVLLRAHLQAKFAGAANYDQVLHFDYPNHTLVVPGQKGEYRQLGFFLYLSDITEDLGPTHLVSKKYSRDLPLGNTHFFRDEESARGRHFFKKAPELYKVEVPAVGPAGSLLVYELDTLHRGSIVTATSGVRLTLGFAYGGSRTWQGYQSWPRLAEEEALMNFITHAKPRERELLGFPSIGDPYWNEDTIARVEARYPGIDISLYRETV